MLYFQFGVMDTSSFVYYGLLMYICNMKSFVTFERAMLSHNDRYNYCTIRTERFITSSGK